MGVVHGPVVAYLRRVGLPDRSQEVGGQYPAPRTALRDVLVAVEGGGRVRYVLLVLVVDDDVGGGGGRELLLLWNGVKTVAVACRFEIRAGVTFADGSAARANAIFGRVASCKQTGTDKRACRLYPRYLDNLRYLPVAQQQSKRGLYGRNFREAILAGAHRASFMEMG